jgi:transposase-like protein
MRLSLILPDMELQKPTPPTQCPYEDCQSTQLRLHQEVVKPLRDTRYHYVVAHRYQCLTCKRTFRVYPQGVNSAPTSQRVKELGVILYMLGLSYRSVSHALEALGVYQCASCIYGSVQASMQHKPEIGRQALLEGIKSSGGGVPGNTLVKYRGQWHPLMLQLDEESTPQHEMVLSILDLLEEDAHALANAATPLVQVRLETTSIPVKRPEFSLSPQESLETKRDGQAPLTPVKDEPASQAVS